MSHPSTATLDLYVMNAIDNKAEVLALEHHLAGCGTCKGILGEAAAFEIELSELASQVIFCIACDQVRVDQDSRCHECGAVASAGGFTIDELLVKNAHGRLYRAHDQNGRQVALKELAFVQTPGPQVLAAFEREAQFLRALNHPRIPKFVASFSEGSGVQTRLYLAQEFIDGSSLQTSLSDSWFDEDKIRAIAMQVLDILVYLQGLSPIVVHRDIKPANLIRREDGELVLVDFGAAHDPAETMGLTFAGTFGYMPVEQLAGTVDETTDVFALGQSLKHLLTRREPWKLTEPDALDAANVSLSLRAFLEKLTANNPAERFPGAAAAMVALKELGSGKLVKLAKSKQTEPKRGFVRRWGSRAALVATGALATTVLVAEQNSHPQVDAELELLCSAYANRYVDLFNRETNASNPQAEDNSRANWRLRWKCEDQGKMTPAILDCIQRAETLVAASKCWERTVPPPKPPLSPAVEMDAATDIDDHITNENPFDTDNDDNGTNHSEDDNGTNDVDAGELIDL